MAVPLKHVNGCMIRTRRARRNRSGSGTLHRPATADIPVRIPPEHLAMNPVTFLEEAGFVIRYQESDNGERDDVEEGDSPEDLLDSGG